MPTLYRYSDVETIQKGCTGILEISTDHQKHSFDMLLNRANPYIQSQEEYILSKINEILLERTWYNT